MLNCRGIVNRTTMIRFSRSFQRMSPKRHRQSEFYWRIGDVIPDCRRKYESFSFASLQSIQEVSSCLIENTVNTDTRIAINAVRASRSNPLRNFQFARWQRSLADVPHWLSL